MPPPDDSAVARFRRAARGLGVDWPDGMRYGDLVRGLDRRDPRHLALIHEATSLFRGAAYTAFDGAPPSSGSTPPSPPRTRTSRPRCGVSSTASGSSSARPPAAAPRCPTPVRAALPDLPDLMRESDRTARTAERACADATEAAVLSGREGSGSGRSSSTTPRRGWRSSSLDLPVLTRVSGGRAELGSTTEVLLERADVRTGEVVFTHP